MSDYAVRDYAYWDFEEGSRDEFAFAEDDRPSVRKPIGIYSKRASLINDIRTHARWAAAHADDDLEPPTQEAQTAACALINQLPEGCLDFRIGISHAGEINFLYGRGEPAFQMLIDGDGLISYYGRFGETRFADSDIRPEDFPYWEFLRLLGTT